MKFKTIDTRDQSYKKSMIGRNGRTDSILRDKLSGTIDLLDQKGQTIDNRHSSSIFKNRYNQKIMENNIFKNVTPNKYENYKTSHNNGY